MFELDFSQNIPIEGGWASVFLNPGARKVFYMLKLNALIWTFRVQTYKSCVQVPCSAGSCSM